MEFVFEVLCSFDALEQVILTIDFENIASKEDITEEMLLRSIFAELHGDELRQLYKISCAQLNTEKEEDLPAFLLRCWGKFFFDTDVNHDDDTRRLKEFKDQYLREHPHQ